MGESGLIAGTTNGGSTWLKQTRGTVVDLYGMVFTSAETGFVVGDSGTILRTTNAGAEWIAQEQVTYEHLYDVFFTSPATGVAVGASGTILRTSNGGTQWSVIPSGTITTLSGVHFADASIGTIVGFNGTVLRTTDGGLSWVNQPTGTARWLRRVYFSDADRGIAVGVGSIIRTINGGQSWIVDYDCGIKGCYVYTALSFVDGQNGFLLGYMNNTGTRYIWRTTNGGIDWSRQDFYGGLADMYFVNPTTGYTVGGFISRTSDGGNTWQHFVSPTRNSLFRVFLTDTNTVTVVGAFGTILQSTTGGIVSVDEPPNSTSGIPHWVVLEQNYPNPFNPTTEIGYQISEVSHVTLRVYNVLGQEVATLVNEVKQPGRYEVTFDGTGLSSGVYFYRLQAGEFVDTKKLLLLK